MLLTNPYKGGGVMTSLFYAFKVTSEIWHSDFGVALFLTVQQ